MNLDHSATSPLAQRHQRASLMAVPRRNWLGATKSVDIRHSIDHYSSSARFLVKVIYGKVVELNLLYRLVAVLGLSGHFSGSYIQKTSKIDVFEQFFGHIYRNKAVINNRRETPRATT